MEYARTTFNGMARRHPAQNMVTFAAKTNFTNNLDRHDCSTTQKQKGAQANAAAYAAHVQKHQTPARQNLLGEQSVLHRGLHTQTQTKRHPPPQLRPQRPFQNLPPNVRWQIKNNKHTFRCRRSLSADSLAPSKYAWI